MRTDTDIATFKVEPRFSDAFTLENQRALCQLRSRLRFSEPLIAATIPLTTPLADVTVTRNVNTGQQRRYHALGPALRNVRWQTAGIHNSSVIGIEGGHEKAAPTFLQQQRGTDDSAPDTERRSGVFGYEHLPALPDRPDSRQSRAIRRSTRRNWDNGRPHWRALGPFRRRLQGRQLLHRRRPVWS